MISSVMALGLVGDEGFPTLMVIVIGTDDETVGFDREMDPLGIEAMFVSGAGRDTPPPQTIMHRLPDPGVAVFA